MSLLTMLALVAFSVAGFSLLYLVILCIGLYAMMLSWGHAGKTTTTVTYPGLWLYIGLAFTIAGIVLLYLGG